MFVMALLTMRFDIALTIRGNHWLTPAVNWVRFFRVCRLNRFVKAQFFLNLTKFGSIASQRDQSGLVLATAHRRFGEILYGSH